MKRLVCLLLGHDAHFHRCGPPGDGCRFCLRCGNPLKGYYRELGDREWTHKVLP